MDPPGNRLSEQERPNPGIPAAKDPPGNKRMASIEHIDKIEAGEDAPVSRVPYVKEKRATKKQLEHIVWLIKEKRAARKQMKQKRNRGTRLSEQEQARPTPHFRIVMQKLAAENPPGDKASSKSIQTSHRMATIEQPAPKEPTDVADPDDYMEPRTNPTFMLLSECPVDKMEAGALKSEDAPIEQMEQKWNAAIANSKQAEKEEEGATPGQTRPPRCCGCCCDYRSATIITDGIIMTLEAILLIVLAANPGAMEAFGYMDSEKLVRAEMIFSAVSIITGAVSILGAIKFNLYLVFVNVIWLVVGFVAGIAVVTDYCSDYYYTDGYYEYTCTPNAANICVAAVAMILFLYPHLGFCVQVKKGVLTKDTYEADCCCCATGNRLSGQEQAKPNIAAAENPPGDKASSKSIQKSHRMASIEPVDKMEAGALKSEDAPMEQMGQKGNAAFANSNHAQTEEDGGGSEGFCSKKRCKVATMAVAILLIVVAIIVGIVVGVKKSDGNSGTGNAYQVDIQWQAMTYDGWNFGFVGPYGTSANVKDGGEAWDNMKEFKVKLDLQGEGNAIVRAELHQSGEAYHVCCTHELHAGVARVDSGYGEWGIVKNCKCPELWYDHQIRAKVTTQDDLPQQDSQDPEWEAAATQSPSTWSRP